MKRIKGKRKFTRTFIISALDLSNIYNWSDMMKKYDLKVGDKLRIKSHTQEYVIVDSLNSLRLQGCDDLKFYGMELLVDAEVTVWL